MSTVTSTGPGAVRAHEICADVRSIDNLSSCLERDPRWHVYCLTRDRAQGEASRTAPHRAYQLRVPPRLRVRSGRPIWHLHLLRSRRAHTLTHAARDVAGERRAKGRETRRLVDAVRRTQDSRHRDTARRRTPAGRRRVRVALEGTPPLTERRRARDRVREKHIAAGAGPLALQSGDKG